LAMSAYHFACITVSLVYAAVFCRMNQMEAHGCWLSVSKS
jgi:hypothetical protein